MKLASRIMSVAMVFGFFPASPTQRTASAAAKLQCGGVVNKSNDLPRTAAIGTNPAGIGAHALASGLTAIASKATPISANRPQRAIRRFDVDRERVRSGIGRGDGCDGVAGALSANENSTRGGDRWP